MSPLAQILVAGAGTYLFRISFIAFAGRFAKVPRRVETMLAMIPPRCSLRSPPRASSTGAGTTATRSAAFDEWHIAIVIAGLVAFRTKSVALCLFVGMPVLWGLAALG